jgi:hypothetical protein
VRPDLDPGATTPAILIEAKGIGRDPSPAVLDLSTHRESSDHFDQVAADLTTVLILHQELQIRFFSSCMLSPRPRISLVNTSKLAGVPASRVFSPLTMLS